MASTDQAATPTQAALRISTTIDESLKIFCIHLEVHTSSKQASPGVTTFTSTLNYVSILGLGSVGCMYVDLVGARAHMEEWTPDGMQRK